jgi:[acyl-carrier-protein] S-malonyltransferase
MLPGSSKPCRNHAGAPEVGLVVSFAVLFPGQGSQFVGMGSDLFAEHGELLGNRSDRILGWSLEEMCLEGPEESLLRTEHAQPALFALSYALWVSLSPRLPEPPAAAGGHSLGEYTALAAAGAFSYDQGLKLVAARGRLMAQAADRESSGMAALLGVDRDIAQAVVDANNQGGGSLQIANLNAPGQVVVAGSSADIEWLVSHSKDHGVRRAIPLKVAGAFHSSYMTPAAEGLQDELDSVEYASLEFPVWANVTASRYDPSSFARTLTSQVTSPVRFEELVTGMSEEGVETFVHVGPGDVTAGLARKTLPEATVLTVSNIEEIDEALAALGTM